MTGAGINHEKVLSLSLARFLSAADFHSLRLDPEQAASLGYQRPPRYGAIPGDYLYRHALRR